MGAEVSRSDFEWTYTEEPHRTRRKQILAKYPQMKLLMGHDPRIKFIVGFMVLTQIATAILLRNASWSTVVIVAYCFGGVINNCTTLALHEASHNLAFGHKYPWRNRLLGIFGNLVTGWPYFVIFTKYHIEHHKYLGVDGVDTDIPSAFEGRFFHNTFTKFFWVLLQPFFYALRPLLLRPKPLTRLDLLNFSVQFTFNIALVSLFGFRSWAYLIIGTFLGMGLHPVAARLISEHYMIRKGYETYSYYGPLNYITFNVGYHCEHHDFPNIPWCNLPKVKEIAPEFYDNLPCHTSWVKVIWDFITDPEIGPYCRVKRTGIRPTQPDCKDKDDVSGKED